MTVLEVLKNNIELRLGEDQKEAETLHDLFNEYKENGEIEIECPFCFDQKPEKAYITYKFQSYPRILLFSVNRSVLDNNGIPTSNFYNKDIIYRVYRNPIRSNFQNRTRVCFRYYIDYCCCC